ncbi:MAG: DNA mismatch repair endonuclease MutL [Erysipelotrichaceae bacterium]|nr:DNA mismatch repair endonuclease MutL [Erysipelotrichaceae bacterium]
MSRIVQLDEQTANMIAAGEVVERPQGVVKELVENAIDAGSTRITITVREGGLASLTVTDDGCGMDSKDAVMAFQRHATSKIRTQSDLWRIHTLGFRGEALPSIASVSKLTLTTSDGNESTRVKIEYGKTVSVSAYPADQGTEITVEGLFYKTPARLKHMRSAAYENSLIQDVVTRFAMSHPEISFRLISDGRTAFQTTGKGNLLEVLYQAWGREAAENAVPVEFSDFDYTVTGYIIKPQITRSTRNSMHVFLNGRMVRTFRLYKAIEDGYEDFIVKGRHPLAVLQIRMDSQLLDVNVHPSKWEVRLSKENQLEQLIRTEINQTLKNTVLAPKVEVSTARQTYYEPLTLDTLDLNTPVKEEAPHIVQPEPVQQKPVQKPVRETAEVISEPEPAPVYTPPVEAERPVVREKFPDMQVIGQLHGKFILCAVENGLAVLDQHACQERVHYEEIRAKLNTEPAMTDCLIPLQVKASADLVQRVDEINEAVSDLHIAFEPFGRDLLIVRRIPLWMKDIDAQTFLQDVMDSFREEREIRYARMEKKKIATMACHRSIRFNRNLTMDEMREVVRQLGTCENPYHCPHGRPTFVILSEKELTKEFLR